MLKPPSLTKIGAFPIFRFDPPDKVLQRGSQGHVFDR
jgi:hypothetical protein